MKAMLKELLAHILGVDFRYPVGSYYETSNANFDPNTAWGGTWVKDTTKDDEIIEEGTNGIWTYRKWKSGIAECWGDSANTYRNMVTAFGYAFYDSNSPSYDFPANLFNQPPTVQANRSSLNSEQGYGGNLVSISPYQVTKTRCSLFVYNTTSATGYCRIALSAKGLWKTYEAPTTQYRWHRTA